MLQHKATWNKARDVWEAPEMDLISGRWAVYSETLPRSGSMRNGELYELPTWERATGEQECSYLPTPVAQPSGNTPEEHLRKKPGREVVTDLAIIAENGLLETGGRLLPTPRASDGPNGGPNMRGSKGDKPLPAAVMDLLPTPTTNIGANGGSQDPDKRRAGGHSVSIQDVAEFKLLPTPIVGDSRGSRNATANRTEPGKASNGWTLSDVVFDGQLAPNTQRFGSYASAVRRHECAFGRVAPEPTAPTGRNGTHRLSSRFIEWMMGLPDGWVTECELSRSAELRILGNGVVPRQATAALTEMRAALENSAARAA